MDNLQPNEMRMPYDFNRVKTLNPRDGEMVNTDNKEFIGAIAVIAPNPKFDANAKGFYVPTRYVKPVEVRLYCTRNGGTVYAKVWAHSRDREMHLWGSGSAGGYGYDMKSAAIEGAFERAGVEMAKSFAGCGESAAQVAIAALAKRLGWKTAEIMNFHP